MKINIKYAISILISSLVIMGCSPTDKFSRSLSKEVSKGHGTKISFQELTDFKWDKVHIYGPYSPLDDINKKHGSKLKGKYDFNHVPEGDCLYIFMKSDKLMKTSFLKRYQASCLDIIDPGTYDPNTAVFFVEVRSKGSHPLLVKEKKL